jgi:hypothetical protein
MLVKWGLEGLISLVIKDVLLHLQYLGDDGEVGEVGDSCAGATILCQPMHCVNNRENSQAIRESDSRNNCQSINITKI